MPIDTKRFNGPENSVPYKCYTKSFLKTCEELSAELVSADSLRKDGRNCTEKRAIHVSTGLIPQAKGSAYVEMRKTKVLVAVFEPREIPHQNEYSSSGQLYCELKSAPFSSGRVRRPYVPDAEEKELSCALKKALEPAVCLTTFPNFQIDVMAYVIENDGSCLAAAINGASLALADACVQMYDLVTAATLAIDRDRRLPDPTHEEEYISLTGHSQGNHGVIVLSKMCTQDQMTDVCQKGSMDYDCLTEALEMLDKDCGAVLPILQRRLIIDTDKALRDKGLKNGAVKNPAVHIVNNLLLEGD